jgi:hypothetical protein
MAGYVDPLGPWRALGWLTIMALPLIAAILATGGDISDWSIPLRIVWGIGIMALTLAAIPLGFRLMRKTRALELTHGPAPVREPLRSIAQRVYDRRWVRRVLSAAWIVLLGAAGSQLAEWL